MTNKKGFTIVELVIVIAIIAILAAVLIPTFSNVISKANQSGTLQAAKTKFEEIYALDYADGTLEGAGTGLDEDATAYLTANACKDSSSTAISTVSKAALDGKVETNGIVLYTCSSNAVTGFAYADDKNVAQYNGTTWTVTALDKLS